MANYLVTDTQLTAIANKLREKTGTVGGIEFVDAFVSEIEKLTDTRDANAAAGDIRSGKSAYVNKQKVNGSLGSKAAATYNTSSSDQTIAANQILDGVQTIKAVTTSNIDAGNIKTGVNVKVGDANSAGRIKNVTGTFTNDANAVAGDVRTGKTAYVNGQKVTGSLGEQAGGTLCLMIPTGDGHNLLAIPANTIANGNVYVRGLKLIDKIIQYRSNPISFSDQPSSWFHSNVAFDSVGETWPEHFVGIHDITSIDSSLGYTGITLLTEAAAYGDVYHQTNAAVIGEVTITIQITFVVFNY